MTKTKFALCGVAACIVASFGVSMCSNKDQTPMDPQVLKTVEMYKCSGFNEYLAQNTPNMPVDIQALQQEMAVEFYKVAQQMPKGANIQSSMDLGRDLAKKYLQEGNRQVIGEQIQLCKGHLQQFFQDKAQKELEQAPVTDTQVDKDMPVPSEAEKVQNAIQAKKQMLQEYTEQLFQCSGIFIYNSTNIPGISKANKDMQLQLGMNTYKLAEMLNDQSYQKNKVDAKIWGMKGADKAHNYVRSNNIEGMKSEMEECQRTIQYVMENKSKIGY